MYMYNFDKKNITINFMLKLENQLEKNLQEFDVERNSPDTLIHTI